MNRIIFRRCMASLGVMLAVTAAAGPATAWDQKKVTQPKGGPPGSWRVIGRTEAGFSADHDSIVVAGPHDNFRRLKFKVTDAGLNLQHLVVTYDNGAPDRIEVRQNIPQGGESRVIDLRGSGQRSLRKVEFWYDTKGIFKGRANVTLFGMH